MQEALSIRNHPLRSPTPNQKKPRMNVNLNKG
jgi:hypothetical protein